MVWELFSSKLQKDVFKLVNCAHTEVVGAITFDSPPQVFWVDRALMSIFSSLRKTVNPLWSK